MIFDEVMSSEGILKSCKGVAWKVQKIKIVKFIQNQEENLMHFKVIKVSSLNDF